MSLINAVTEPIRRKRATVRRRTLAAIASTTIVLTLVLCAISRIFLVQRFSDLEEARVADSLDRARIAIQDEIVQLDRVAADNAIFDDTVRFMAHPNDAYIRSNFGSGKTSTLARENYQALAFLDPAFRVVATQAYDPERELDISISPSLLAHLSRRDKLAILPLLGTPVTGIILVREGPMLVSARSILPSETQGSPRGVLFMGCYLKPEDLQRLEGKTHLHLSIERVDDPKMASDYAIAQSHLSTGSAAFVHPLDADTIAGYSLLGDIYGKPAIILRAEMPRTIYHQGQLTLLYLAAALTIAGLVFGVVIEQLLQKVLLSRLRELDVNVGRIARSGDPEARVSYGSDDEIGRFGEAINRMLDSLQISQSEKRQAEDRYRIFMDNSPLLAAIKDQEGRYVYVNQPFAKTFNISADELYGRTSLNAVNPEVARQILRNDFEVLACGQPLQFEETIPTPDGVHRSWLSFRFPLQSEDLPRSLGILALDITERRKAEVELKEAKEAAESAALVKAQFLTTISHELRTPMSGIMGLTDLVLATELDATQREHISLIKFSAESLLAVVNDVLDFSKLEAGKLELDMLPFELEASVRESIALLKVLATRKGLRLLLSLAPEVPRHVLGDSIRLRQVLLNLIGNAVKFTSQGEVRLSVATEKSDDETVSLHFQVADTGIGIPMDKQQIIFERFSQADSSTTRQFGGTGLGLAISSRLVSMMDGRIWVESRPGTGSTFHFTAKFGRCGEQSSFSNLDVAIRNCVSPVPAATSPKLRILVAEDNRVNQLVIERLLKAKEHSILMVENGQQALGALERESFDLLITDVQMPELDGYGLAAAIRASEVQTGKRLPILGLSAHAFTEDRDKCLAAGMDAYLSKPVRTEQLHQAISELAGAAPLPLTPL